MLGYVDYYFNGSDKICTKECGQLIVSFVLLLVGFSYVKCAALFFKKTPTLAMKKKIHWHEKKIHW